MRAAEPTALQAVRQRLQLLQQHPPQNWNQLQASMAELEEIEQQIQTLAQLQAATASEVA